MFKIYVKLKNLDKKPNKTGSEINQRLFLRITNIFTIY